MGPTPEEMAASMIANLPDATGRTLAEWTALVRATGLEKHGQIVKHLKTEHRVTHGYANLIAHEARRAGDGAAAADDLVEAQYGGAKAGLRPIYDRILAAVTAFGDDVEVAPKKGYVSLRRRTQFALVQPSTKTRVDVGINLKGQPPTERLEDSGSFNQMVSHRVRVGTPDEVDEALVAWLRAAYEAS